MVRMPAAMEAAKWSREHPRLSVGLHLDFCEWRYESEEWRCTYEVVSAHDAAAVTTETRRQLNAFRQIMQAEPTHIDSHQHVHRSEPMRSIVRQVAGELGIPVRGEDAVIRYCGDFYGQSDKGFAYHQSITVASLHEIITTLPPGITELGCHPGLDPALDSVYREERLIECRTLCAPEIRDALAAAEVRLIPFPGGKQLKAVPT
jgi:predicted glycoside hydrolase/deacetylase ChbG (UPF0249 family)